MGTAATRLDGAPGFAVKTSGRAQDLLGVLYAPIVSEELLDGVSEVAGGRLDVEIFDGHGTAAANLVHDADGSLAARDLDLCFSHTRFLLPGDRIFSLRTTTQPAFDAIHGHGTTAFVSLAGLAVSLLAAWGASAGSTTASLAPRVIRCRRPADAR